MPQNQAKASFQTGRKAVTAPKRREAANEPQSEPQPERYPLSEMGQQQRRQCPWLPMVDLS